MPDRVYWDSCLFIELFQQNIQARFDACDVQIAMAKAGQLVIVTSAVSITEVNKSPNAKPLSDSDSQKILDYFENDFINVRQVTRHVAEKAHDLARKLNLLPLDAIHLATAMVESVPVLYTYDGYLIHRRKGLLVHDRRVGNPVIRIEHPPTPSPGPLFSKND